jgi:hypothetical protein
MKEIRDFIEKAEKFLSTVGRNGEENNGTRRL